MNSLVKILISLFFIFGTLSSNPIRFDKLGPKRDFDLTMKDLANIPMCINVQCRLPRCILHKTKENGRICLVCACE